VSQLLCPCSSTKLIDRDYISNNVPYVIMRSFPAILGLALIPIAFLTLIALRLSLATAILGALLITFENALIAQSRLILLDSFLLFFTGLTMYFWVKFANLDSDGAAFTRKWWINLTLTGLGLGAVVSCKWVGLFTIAAVGCGTLRQLWLLLGNLKVTPKMWIKHFAARGLCLIVVPGVFYMFMFQIHFWILTQSGDGDGFMSSEFQHTLSGHGMDDTYAGKLSNRVLSGQADEQTSGSDPSFPSVTSTPKEDTSIPTLTHIPPDQNVSCLAHIKASS
jgi:dolichyl-phosphate-mannose-protein mannosyltransferase